MFIILFFVLGLIFGSFINCLIYRLKQEKTILGRSFCPKCRHILGFFDLFPLFSYIFLNAKCRYCKEKIAFEYFLVELFTGFVFAFGYWFYFLSKFWFVNSVLFFIFYLIISVFLIIIFIYDLKYYLVLDKVIWPAIIIAFCFNFLILKVNLLNLLLAGAIGIVFFGWQFLISKGKWIGGGDILIGLLMGFILGFPNILLGIFFAYIIGGIIGVFLLILKKKSLSSKIPFGPFLVFSILFIILFGNRIIDWYLSFLF